MALMSAMFWNGVRQLALRNPTRSSFSLPPMAIFMGGTKSPSWKTSVLDGEIEDGTRPPMSMKWMKHQP